MIKKLLAAAAVASVAVAAPALAQVERHQNPSLNGYSGFATEAQAARSTAFGTAAEREPVEALGSGNPSLESFNPNAVDEQSTRFQTAPSIADNPNFSWIDRADIGA